MAEASTPPTLTGRCFDQLTPGNKDSTDFFSGGGFRHGVNRVEADHGLALPTSTEGSTSFSSNSRLRTWSEQCRELPCALP
ncbi:hypothetical protein ACLOJK_011838 [Asimina triloba]